MMHKAQGSALGRAWLLSAQGPALPARAAGVPLFPAGVNSRTAAPEEKKPQLIIQREKEPAPTFCLAGGGGSARESSVVLCGEGRVVTRL